MNRQSSFHPRWMAATLVGMVCVLGLTHIPQQAIPRVLQANALDKLEHVAAYGLVAGLFLLSLKRPVHLVWLLIGLAALAVIGAVDEVTQPLVNRTASMADYVSDLAGMAVAGTVFLVKELVRANGYSPLRAMSARKAARQRGQSD